MPTFLSLTAIKNLVRGQLVPGNIIAVQFADGDYTQCEVLKENQSCTGVVCKVLSNLGPTVSVETGEKRVFKYGNNPERTLYVPNSTQTGENTKPMGDVLRKLSPTLARVLSPKLKAQFEAGLIDETLELTAEGRRELRAITRDVHEEALAARAKEILAEREKEKKDCK